MNFKTTYILFGILGAMFVVLGLVLWIGPGTPPPKGFIFPSAHAQGAEVKPDNIDRVVIESPDSDAPKIVFAMEGGEKNRHWVMKEPISGRLDRFAVDMLVREVLDASRDEQAELNKDLKKWGLESPRRIVTLEGGGKTFELKLGASSGVGGDAVVYVVSSDYPKTPLAVLRDKLTAADTYNLDQFRSRDLLAESDSDIGYVSVRGTKGDPVIVESSDGRWSFVKPAYGPADPEGGFGTATDKAPTGVRQLLGELVALKVDAKTEAAADKDKKPKEKKKKKDTGFVENNASEATLKKYGLESDKTAELVLTVKRSPAAKQATTLLVGKKADDKGEQFYARLASDRNVVKVAGKNLEPIRKFLANPEEMRDHNLVRLTDKPDVVRIKYRSGETVELIRAPQPNSPHAIRDLPDLWKLYLGSDKQGMLTDPATVRKLVDMLLAQRSVKEFPAGKTDKELGLDSPDVVVSLWVKGIKEEKKKKDEDKKDEKKDKKDKDKKKDDKKEDKKKEEERPQLKSQTPDVELLFGAVGSDKLVAVRRKTGKGLKDVTVVKVDEAVVVQARENPLTYLDKQLPPLVPFTVALSAVSNITVDLDGKVTEVSHKGGSGPWLFDKPSDLRGRKADAVLMNDLYNDIAHAESQGWAALKPTDAQLTAWGLKAPRSKATVSYTSDGKTQEKSLLIGKETSDKKGYYAKQSDSERVFILPVAELEKLKKPLLDLTVFDFTASSVKAVKLTVKPKPLKANMVELERKSATDWVATKPAGVKISAPRAESLVESLEHLKAEKFIDKPAAKDAYELDVKQGALEIEITLDNKDKEKLTLTVGKADGGSFYATSNKQPGAVFLIGKGKDSVFEKIKNDLAFLVVE